jgi:hypothetical protein
MSKKGCSAADDQHSRKSTFCVDRHSVPAQNKETVHKEYECYAYKTEFFGDHGKNKIRVLLR